MPWCRSQRFGLSLLQRCNKIYLIFHTHKESILIICLWFVTFNISSFVFYLFSLYCFAHNCNCLMNLKFIIHEDGYESRIEPNNLYSIHTDSILSHTDCRKWSAWIKLCFWILRQTNFYRYLDSFIHSINIGHRFIHSRYLFWRKMFSIQNGRLYT